MAFLLQAQGIPQTVGGFIDLYGPAVLGFLATVAVFFLVFVVLYLGRGPIHRLVRQSLETREFKPGIISIAMSIVAVVTLAGAFAIAATAAGFGSVLLAFTTLAGALTLAIGFASQDLIANFVAGIFILKDEPFKTGDWIEWDGDSGVVREITLRTTRLNSFDNELVTVPNSDLANAVVTNPVANDTLRLTYNFGISYDDDIELAQRIITDVGDSLDETLADPAPSTLVTDLGDSAVVISGRVWINPQESGAAPVRAAFVKGVKEQFDAEGIDMPYPHTTLTGEVDVTERPGSAA